MKTASVFWFYHCSDCGAVFVKYHSKCLLCKATNTLNQSQAAIVVKGSDNFPLPCGVGIQSDRSGK